MSEQKPKQMVQNISCVLSQTNQIGALYAGNIYGAQNGPILKQYGIRAVISLSTESNVKYSSSDIPYHLVIHAYDNDDYSIVQHLQECIQFIETRRKLTNVYVHCFAGVSRSVTVCIAYLIRKYRWNLDKALTFMKFKRVVSKPNDGFMLQLKRFEQHEFSQQNNKTKRVPELSQFISSTRYVNELSANSSPKIVKRQQNIANQNYFSPDYKHPSVSTDKLKQISRLIILKESNPFQNANIHNFQMTEAIKFVQPTVPNINRSNQYVTKSKISDSKRDSIHNSLQYNRQIQPQRKSIHLLSPFKVQKYSNQMSNIRRDNSLNGIMYQPRILNRASSKNKQTVSSVNNQHKINDKANANYNSQHKDIQNPLGRQSTMYSMLSSQKAHQLNSAIRNNYFNQSFLGQTSSPRHNNKIYPQSSIYFSKSPNKQVGQTSNNLSNQNSQLVRSKDPHSNVLSQKKQIEISSNSRISYKHDTIPIPKISTRRDKNNGGETNIQSLLNRNEQEQLNNVIRQLAINKEQLNKKGINDYQEQNKSKSRIVRPKDLPGYKRY